MKRLKNNPTLTDLPAPVTLTLEQLAQVASDTGTALGGGALRVVICGGPLVGPADGAVTLHVPGSLELT